MAMTVRYNGSANRALSHADKNDKVRSKALAKVASGMKINSAADDAASFSIGSKMRVKLRALDQDAQNVQNGSAILNTAEGGIQGQIDLLRTIREKVINAANDSNTDEDRQTIQKELYHLYTQMENIAYETDYNSKKPLLADTKILYGQQGIANTVLELIPNQYPTLDNVNGPFDIFTEYSDSTAALGTTTGYVPGTSKVMSSDFSAYNNVSDLNNVGIAIGSSTYVFTNDTSKNYRYAYRKIDISNAASVSEAMDKLKSYFSGGSVDGTKLNIPAVSISGASDASGSVTTSVQVPNTGTGAGISGTASGGVSNPTGDADLAPAAKATLEVSLSDVTSNTGFQFDGTNFRVIDPGATVEGTVDRTLTKGESSSGTAGSFNYTFDGNNLTFTAIYDGAEYNNTSIVNSYTYYTRGNQTTDYTAYTAYSGTVETVSNGTSPTYASWSLALTTVDDFSAQFAGKTFQLGDGTLYKFYDSKLAPLLEGFAEDSGSRATVRTQIDINEIRQAVDSGSTTLAQAVALRLGGTADGSGVKFTGYYNGTEAKLMTETLRHYDIDFSNVGVAIPDGLYGKGFRAYCATDNKEWFNFVFTDGTDSYDSDKDNIKSVNIDVSAVTNAAELVRAIYKQANPILTGDDMKYNHHLRLAADLDNKTLTIYDHRRFDVSQAPYHYQERGAKIADGVLFTEDDEPVRELWVRDLVIQHTDKAGMNIHIQIPQMTLDKVFDPLPVDPSTIFDYPVTSKDSRNALLGNPNPPGILDNGLKYLLDAVTLVGAQNRRLEFTAENITTEMENLTASESVILDADMAKEMTEYTKQ